ncbi:MAG: cupredoxin domain-containing protein [Thaumarchaeota archaeon]|nr:cupredoxin domain-containing protein [Nitrososphaerota archaeon]
MTILMLTVALVAGLIGGFYLSSIYGTASTASISTSRPVANIQLFIFAVQESKMPWAFVSSGVSNPTIRVKLGSNVQIILNNTGVALHDWALDSISPSPYSVRTEEVRPGESGAISFVADKLGSFTYHCATPGHREYGMQGQIIIEG